jgi:hypothetical protein
VGNGELLEGLTGTGLDLRADAVDSYTSVAYFFRCGAGEADDAVLDTNQHISSVLRGWDSIAEGWDCTHLSSGVSRILRKPCESRNTRSVYYTTSLVH